MKDAQRKVQTECFEILSRKWGLQLITSSKSQWKKRFSENFAFCFSTVSGPVEASSCLEVNVSLLASCTAMP